jgi:hypothetical protein
MPDEDDFLRRESSKHKVSAQQRIIAPKKSRPLHELVKSAMFRRKKKKTQE